MILLQINAEQDAQKQRVSQGVKVVEVLTGLRACEMKGRKIDEKKVLFVIFCTYVIFQGLYWIPLIKNIYVTAIVVELAFHIIGAAVQLEHWLEWYGNNKPAYLKNAL